MSEKKKVDSEELVGKYLTFVLGDGEYAVGIHKVQQIIQMQQITRIPKAQNFIRGVINLRGKVIPVLNLSNKFNMDAAEETSKTCIVIVEISDKDVNLTLGIIIDEVKEVMHINLDMLTDTPPDIGQSNSAKHIIGAVRVNDKVRFILDLDEILSLNEKMTLKRTF